MVRCTAKVVRHAALRYGTYIYVRYVWYTACAKISEGGEVHDIRSYVRYGT